MKLFSAFVLCALAMVKPVFGSGAVIYKVGDATYPDSWNIETTTPQDTNVVTVGFALDDEAAKPYLSAEVSACDPAGSGFSIDTPSIAQGSLEGTSTLSVTLTNTAHVVDTTYCFVVTLFFNFEAGATTKQVLHAKQFSYQVTADGSGTQFATDVNTGSIATTTDDGNANAGADVDRTLSGITLTSNPGSDVTWNEQITLTAIADPSYTSFYYQITEVKIGVDTVTTGAGAWAQGSGATISFSIPIGIFAAAGQGGAITMEAKVGWSAVDPTRRALRALQGDEEQLPESGTTTSTVSISVDPAAMEEANAFVASDGHTFTITKTMIAATGAVAAVAVL